MQQLVFTKSTLIQKPVLVSEPTQKVDQNCPAVPALVQPTPTPTTVDLEPKLDVDTVRLELQAVRATQEQELYIKTREAREAFNRHMNDSVEIHQTQNQLKYFGLAAERDSTDAPLSKAGIRRELKRVNASDQLVSKLESDDGAVGNVDIDTDVNTVRHRDKGKSRVRNVGDSSTKDGDPLDREPPATLDYFNVVRIGHDKTVQIAQELQASAKRNTRLQNKTEHYDIRREEGIIAERREVYENHAQLHDIPLRAAYASKIRINQLRAAINFDTRKTKDVQTILVKEPRRYLTESEREILIQSRAYQYILEMFQAELLKTLNPVTGMSSYTISVHKLLVAMNRFDIALENGPRQGNTFVVFSIQKVFTYHLVGIMTGELGETEDSREFTINYSYYGLY